MSVGENIDQIKFGRFGTRPSVCFYSQKARGKIFREKWGPGTPIPMGRHLEGHAANANCYSSALKQHLGPTVGEELICFACAKKQICNPLEAFSRLKPKLAMNIKLRKILTKGAD